MAYADHTLAADGSAVHLLGTDGGLPEIRASWYGATPQAGSALSRSGEVVAVGVPYGSGGGYRSGLVRLVPADSGTGNLSDLGPALSGESDYDLAGSQVAWLGDTDGDGQDDLAVGAHYGGEEGLGEHGVLYVVRGPVTGPMSLFDADLRLQGHQEGDNLGSGVAAPGDLNGDGLADLAVGARYDDSGQGQAGASYLVTRLEPGHVRVDTVQTAKIVGHQGGMESGARLEVAGDLDGDGASEIAISAPYFDAYRGGAWVVSGATQGVVSLEDTLVSLQALEAGTYHAITDAGSDLDGDGSPDLIWSSGYADEGAEDGGALWLLPGVWVESIAESE